MMSLIRAPLRDAAALGFAAMSGMLLGGQPAAAQFYEQTNLVSDRAGLAEVTDPNLVNPWGIVLGPSNLLRVSDNGTGVSTAYRESGKPFQSPAHQQIITIPPPEGSPAGTTAAPTGVVLNTTKGFVVSEGKRSAASLLIFATEDGTVSGWSPTVDATNAILKVDNSPSGNAVYKGIALAANSSGNFIFVTNFRAGTVEVYDDEFNPTMLSGSFVDPALPAPGPGQPPGFAPFGIANVRGQLYVTYAMQDDAKHDDVAGAGLGFVDVFDTDGNLLRRFASQGTLNSPWGIALAPADFGKFSGNIIIGNFGDGRINAFDRATGTFEGQLESSAGNPITIDGLWGLLFVDVHGPDQDMGPATQTATLFFTAGIDGEAHGLFGKLQPSSASP